MKQILRDKGKFTGQKRKDIPSRGAAIGKISRLKKVTCLLENCEQFIQTRTQNREW
jgi:hypothetical protein